MSDLNHYIGGGLILSPTGSLSPADGLLRSKQRILRRLLTNPGDYIFQPDYGAGLGQYVGALMNIAEITALIRGQVLMEEGVSRSPAPQITVTPSNNTLSVTVSYTDSGTGEPVTLSFDVSR